ncbi:MAG: zinc-ribbon domain-containing protein, partial [Paracoccaceae bacterium]
MRLICPNCSAQYEVPADVIPAEGRDVQCSNCQETWFQTHPDTEPQTDVAQTLKEHFAQTEPEAAPVPPQTDAVSEPDPIDDEFERALNQELDTIAEDDPESSPAPAITHERSKREIDPSVADILREEAQREREQRAAETFEHQDEFALDTDEPTSDPQPKKSGYIDPKFDDLDEMYKDTASDAPASRRDLLPDIEEINSTLRRDKKSAGKEVPETQAQKNASGRSGFRAAIILLLLAVAVYAYADLITSNVPQLAPYL